MHKHLRFFSLLAIVSALLATPALAMNWKIYAPDEDGSRYWLDADSIVTGGNAYTYAYYQILAAGSSAPTETSAPIIGIQCATGNSIHLKDGQWVPGNHFDKRAYLFNVLCPSGK